MVSSGRGEDLVALDEALKTLAEVDPRKSQVVEMRFFGGLSVEETAEVLKVSPDTVLRDWRLAKLWLLRELSGETHDDLNAGIRSSRSAKLHWSEKPVRELRF